MVDGDADDRRFEEWGVELVRLRVQNQSLPGAIHGAATTWLATRDREKRLQDEEERQINKRIASRTETAAWIAAVASIIGTLLAVASLVVALHG
jgi:hypothetical protein